MADVGARVMTRHRMIGVAKEGFAIFGGYASCSQATGERVAKVVNANQWQAGFMPRLLPAVVHPFHASAVVREDPNRSAPPHCYRIQGALANLSHKVGRGTIANVLKRNGIEPSPERSRRTPWSTFLKAHWKVLAASDFLTVEVWTGRGLVTHYLLFVISLADRVVKIAGITTRPDESWMLQIARNVTDSQAGALHAKRYLIIDRDTKYSAAISAADSG